MGDDQVTIPVSLGTIQNSFTASCETAMPPSLPQYDELPVCWHSHLNWESQKILTLFLGLTCHVRRKLPSRLYASLNNLLFGSGTYVHRSLMPAFLLPNIPT